MRECPFIRVCIFQFISMNARIWTDVFLFGAFIFHTQFNFCCCCCCRFSFHFPHTNKYHFLFYIFYGSLFVDILVITIFCGAYSRGQNCIIWKYFGISNFKGSRCFTEIFRLWVYIRCIER